MRGFKNRGGFTLSEVLAVVTIIGVMAALAYPHYELILEKFKAQEQVHLMLAVMVAQKEYYLNHNKKYTPIAANLDIDIGSSLYFAAPLLGCGGTGSNCETSIATNFLSCSAGLQPYMVRVKRVGFTPDYYLYAHENGEVWCHPVSGACPGICPKLGFKY